MPTTKKPAAKRKKANGGSSKAAEGEPNVRTLAEPKEKILAVPKEKSIAAPKAKETRAEVWMVELVEGSSYAVAGQTFLINRPIPVSNPVILDSVLNSSRFKCKPHVKPKPPKKEKKAKDGGEEK